MSNFRCPSSKASHVQAALEEADDEVIDSIRNVKEGEFTHEHEMPDGVECFCKVQREEGNISLDDQVLYM